MLCLRILFFGFCHVPCPCRTLVSMSVLHRSWLYYFTKETMPKIIRPPFIVDKTEKKVIRVQAIDISNKQQLSNLSQVFGVGYMNQKRIMPDRAINISNIQWKTNSDGWQELEFHYVWLGSPTSNFYLILWKCPARNLLQYTIS